MADNVSTQVRRPQDKAELIEELVRSDKPGSHGAFKTYRDVMLFAAAVGWEARRSEAFAKAHLPIEWSIMVNGFGAEQLIDLIAFSETGEAEILSTDRLAERVRIFEGYANGGLQTIDELIKREALTPQEAVHKLITRQLHRDERDLTDDTAPDIRELEKGLGLD